MWVGFFVLVFRVVCCDCGYWNRVPANKIFIEQTSPIDPDKVKVMVPVYVPLEVSKCKKCEKTIAEPKELIRILKLK
jgi:hypothetical protein